MLRRIAAICALLVVSFLLFIVCATIYADTTSALSVSAFHVGYKIVPFKKAYLSFYSPFRRDVSAGYIPPQVDAFLCGRAESTSDLAEFDAIVHFYTIQSGGREGDCIFRTNDITREKIAARITVDLSETDYEGQLVLLEEVRLGKSLGKGNVGLGPGAISWPSTPEEWKAWHRDALPFARSKYIEWWRADTDWETKKLTDPLAGQYVHVNACCG
jgi:hypothetical protein